MIEVQNWHKSFGKNHVLRGVNCRVETGEVVVILGASGSGKSTFLRTLNFLERADEGTLILDDMTLDMKSSASGTFWLSAARPPWSFSLTISSATKQLWRT